MTGYILLAAAWLLFGLAAALYWCWNADEWRQRDWACALMLLWLGPLLLPLGTLPWGDHGATWTKRIRQNKRIPA